MSELQNAIKKLDILAEQPIVIGTFHDIQIAVYPPSIARYREVTKRISDLPAEVQDLIATVSDAQDDDKSTVEQKIELFQKLYIALSERIAPVIVAMTARPVGGGQWEDVLTTEQIENDLSAKTCLSVMTAYEEIASVPELSKKMNALSR